VTLSEVIFNRLPRINPFALARAAVVKKLHRLSKFGCFLRTLRGVVGAPLRNHFDRLLMGLSEVSFAPLENSFDGVVWWPLSEFLNYFFEHGGLRVHPE